MKQHDEIARGAPNTRAQIHSRCGESEERFAAVTGLSQPKFARLLNVDVERCGIGNKAGGAADATGESFVESDQARSKVGAQSTGGRSGQASEYLISYPVSCRR